MYVLSVDISCASTHLHSLFHLEMQYLLSSVLFSELFYWSLCCDVDDNIARKTLLDERKRVVLEKVCHGNC